jgi:hypothetical protein
MPPNAGRLQNTRTPTGKVQKFLLVERYQDV